MHSSRSGTAYQDALLSAILNWVCPECGGPMGGPSKEFQCRGRCGTDWRSAWESACSQNGAAHGNTLTVSEGVQGQQQAPREFFEHGSN